MSDYQYGPLFKMVCYLALMQNGEGLKDKHPSYIGEKLYLLQVKEPLNAFRALDLPNMQKVMGWCERWKFEPPPGVVEEYHAQLEAAAELIEKGFKI